MASLAFPKLAKKATLSDGTTYGYVHVPPSDPAKPTFLLLHGAPESHYGWHPQIESLPRAGYGVLVPDLLGYGDTDAPAEVEPYQLRNMTPQVHELVTRHVGLQKVIGVGHDWGSGVLSHLYVHHRDLFTSLVFIAVGFNVIKDRLDMDAYNAMTEQAAGYPTSNYFHFFTSPDGAAIADKNDRAFDSLMWTANPEDWKTHLGAPGGLAKFLASGTVLPTAAWISPEEMALHSRIIKTGGGYTGVFNWYKAAAQFPPPEEDRAVDTNISVPTLLVLAERDYAVVPMFQEHATREAAGDLLEVTRVDTGHWVQLEDRDGVHKLLTDWAAKN